MAQFFQVSNISINPESIEAVKSFANGVIEFVFSDRSVEKIDATAIGDPNDLSELKQTLESTGRVSLVLTENALINPDQISYLKSYNSGTRVQFKSGSFFFSPLSLYNLSQLIDERVTGRIIKQVESFSLSVADNASTGSGDFTAALSAANLYSGVIPTSIAFNAGEVSGFEAGRWLIVPGVTYFSTVANSLPRLKTLINNADEVGIIRPYYPVANDTVYGSYSFVKNLTPASAIKLVYGDNNPASSSFVIRCSFIKLADDAPLLLNTNGAVTIGGVVVTINGIPLVV